MNVSEIQNKVFEIVAKTMEIPLDQVSEASSSDKIATWDSMTQMSLILALQEEFGVRFTAVQATELMNVKMILSTLESQLKTR